MAKTKREMYETMLNIEAIANNAEVVDFIKHQIELLDNKKNAPKKPTEKQKENETFKVEILTYLAAIEAPVTIKDLQGGIEAFKDLSNQRITRLLIDLRNNGKVKRTYIKKVAYFELGNEHENVEVAEGEDAEA